MTASQRRLERIATTMLTGKNTLGIVRQRGMDVAISDRELGQKLAANARARARQEIEAKYLALPKDLRRDLCERFKRDRQADMSIGWNDWIAKEI